MSFLVRLSATILEWSATQMVKVFAAWIKKHEAEVKAESDAKKLQKTIESAKTPDEKKAAVTDIATKSF